jgi:hypothetical protein
MAREARLGVHFALMRALLGPATSQLQEGTRPAALANGGVGRVRLSANRVLLSG